jgi:hypothetical protein
VETPPSADQAGSRPSQGPGPHVEAGRGGGTVSPPTPAGPSEPLWVKLAPAIVAIVPVILSLVAGGVYATVRTSYATFYGGYGVTPEDVGFSQQLFIIGAVRAFQAWSPDYWPPASKIWIPIVILIGLLLLEALGSFIISRGLARASLLVRTIIQAAWVLTVLLGIIIVLIWARLPQERDALWGKIAKQQHVDPRGFNFLGVNASPAEVFWLKANGESAPEGFPTATVMYLGHDDDAFVVFDPTGKGAWRIPKEKALVRLTPTEEAAPS